MPRHLRCLPLGVPERSAAQVLAALAALMSSSCGVMRNGSAWGETATLHPFQEDALRAARDAALDPWTWAPLAGAALLSIDDLDEGLSDWAREHTPLFGSTGDARRASDDLLQAAKHSWWVSTLATPSGSELAPWARNKVQGFAVEWSAVELTRRATGLARDAVDRERPDGSDEHSFVSAHASTSAAYCALTWRNLDSIELHDAARIPLRGGLIALAGSSAWARVEAGEHYPTDVLAGAALGNFIASFVHDAFLGRAPEVQWSLFADPSSGEIAVGFSSSR
ncbi:MAG: phosphatase PAP2 family protein [Planctomycetes bacterium]|nr:phosphatase PAP2 family protein [Planctomycetota bacterium]